MKIPKKVYELLNIETESNENPWFGGVKRFSEISYDTLKKIAEILGEEFAYDMSPLYSVSELLSELEEYKDQTVFGGYLTSPKRADERLSIDFVITIKNDETILFLRHADYFEFTNDGHLYANW